MPNRLEKEEKVNIAIEIAVKLGLLFLVIYITYLIAKPFLPILIWAIIIAVALQPVITMLEARFGHRKKIIISMTLLVVTALALPTYLLSDTMIETGHQLATALQDGSIDIPPPTEKVKEWPLVGEKAYKLWDAASHNLGKTLAPFKNEIKHIAGSVFSALGNGLGTILMFIGAMIIAAFFLLGAEEGEHFYKTIMRRLLGDKGDEWANLSTLTIRSVVTGVLGVAVIQGFLAFIGLALMGVPFSIVWALAIMFLTIIQMPALIVIGPVIAWVFSQGSGTPEIIFTVYMLIVGALDGVLKPILMGRGVDIPMLVILIGAIGGMMLLGMIGLFIGAVVFALAYKLFELWIAEVKEEEEAKQIS